MFSLSPPPPPLLSVDDTIANRRGIDYKGLISSASEQDCDSGSGLGVANKHVQDSGG